MSILTTPLPDCIVYKGKRYRLNTDFRIWIEFGKIMQSKKLADSVKAKMIYDLCFREPPPYGAALDSLAEFYGGSGRKGDGGGKAVLSFEQDADYIYAAFYAQYGIDLAEAKLHWHKFRALLAGLNEDSMIVKIMQIRSIDLSKLKDKNEKAHYRKLKGIYRLKGDIQDAGEALEGLFGEVSK